MTIRIRSFWKRISSRRQTIFTARTSERQLRGGTRTWTVGRRGRRRRRDRVALIAVPLPSPAARRGCGSCAADSSASRIVDPVWVMKTSSRVGRERLTDLIGTSSSAKSRGTNSSPSATAKLTTPSRDRRLEAEALAQLGDRRLVVGGLDPDPVRPDRLFQRRGRVEGDDLAAVHDRDPPAELGLVHVMGGHEDRDLLLLLELADVAPDRAPRLRVEADRRLVEEEDARRVHQPAGDLQAPPHPAGEGHHLRVAPLPEADHLQHLLHPRLDQLHSTP